MTTLSKNWVTEKCIDFEYKQYVLLAYLKDVNEFFKEKKLYPKFSELIDHYKQLIAIKEKKQNFISSFPKRIKKIDPVKLQIEYQGFVDDNQIMKEIEEIINYSMPQFEHYILQGKKIYDLIEEHIRFFTIGLQPIHSKNFGYLLLKDGKSSEIKAYEYEVKLFEESDLKYKGISINYITSYTRSITNTLESIKVDLIENNNKYPNPATYAIETDISFPYEESFLPIAKRYLVKHVS